MADATGTNRDYAIPTSIYTPAGADGKKIWMVGTECIMTLFALLYAFPHIPGALLEDVYEEEGSEAADSQWFSVTSTAAMRAAMEAILKTSEVLRYSLAAGKTMDDVTKEVVSDVDALSRTFDLHLDDPHVPLADAVRSQWPRFATCRQMFDFPIRGIPACTGLRPHRCRIQGTQQHEHHDPRGAVGVVPAVSVDCNGVSVAGVGAGGGAEPVGIDPLLLGADGSVDAAILLWKSVVLHA